MTTVPKRTSANDRYFHIKQVIMERMRYFSVCISLLISVTLSFTAYSEQKLYFVHSDHLGTPQMLTDENQTVVWKAEYAPFGEATVDEDPDGDGIAIEFNLRFPGQYYDKETDTSYNLYRTYSASEGRYIQSDPIGLEGGINTYGYALQNPIIFTDPNGLKTVPCPPGTVSPGVPCYITIPDGSDNDSPYPPNYCPSGDCAVYHASSPGGFSYGDTRPQCEIDEGLCTLNCNMVSVVPVAGVNKLVGGNIFTGIGAGLGRSTLCSWICRK